MFDVDKRCPGCVRLRLPVEIYMQQRCLGRYITRDVDLVGMFVEATVFPVHPHDIVELVFLTNDGKRGTRPLRATVIRHARDGIGLIFLDDNDSVAAAVQPQILAVM